MRGPSVPGRIVSFLSRISTRLFAFNLLIVFLPIAGFLSLGTYERQLLSSLEGSLVQQGRVLASALEDSGTSFSREAVRIILHLRQRHESRLRVVDERGTLLADSSRLAPVLPAETIGTTGTSGTPDRRASEPDAARGAQKTFLYRLASLPIRLWRRLFRPPVQAGKLVRHVQIVESFASDVSHELKNPLASIRSAVELAQSEEDVSERRELLSMALGDVSRMERLLEGVRDISRIDSGGEESGSGTAAAEEGTRDVRQIVERVLQAFRMRSDGARVRYAVEGPGAGAAVPPQRILQMVENLVDNAAGFSPEGGCVLVEVGTDGPLTLLRVSDQGPGLPEEHAGRIFDRFFSFRPGEDKGAHAGLGLAIVKSIAESHGGSVRAFNLPAGGACFEVRVSQPYSRR